MERACAYHKELIDKLQNILTTAVRRFDRYPHTFGFYIPIELLLELLFTGVEHTGLFFETPEPRKCVLHAVHTHHIAALATFQMSPRCI